MNSRSLPAGTVALTVHRTPLGPVALGASDEAILYCVPAPLEQARRRLGPLARELIENAGGFTPSQARLLSQARSEIDSYLRRERSSFTVPVDLRAATPFSQEVMLSLQAFVSYGHTATYTEIATKLLRPKAARAVGGALAANPVCVILPCHRVVGSRGLTGYAGGLPAKRFLLALESAAPVTPENLLVTPATAAERPAR
ncbi:methylated-DNA--[protein]-cysteine S-methyltransferase [Streptomyces albipurpureus]|uniref:Methylated-DNA--[protein]-cysteine S-methyltransferase n=1 Tax=Streptomyces albipurpureus TaxID=2897419 RepID=A0ABT0UI78_9ACTN|nr:methylated-DNA--[protein]-cysteine S-methyltransferase [Streptomyces sp. CWNU-1]MCM2388372.1 methylated-DNA--[protein]-cysteine S-methyltransferase [Streptomyces sp. CWNU-1]